MTHPQDCSCQFNADGTVQTPCADLQAQIRRQHAVLGTARPDELLGLVRAICQMRGRGNARDRELGMVEICATLGEPWLDRSELEMREATIKDTLAKLLLAVSRGALLQLRGGCSEPHPIHGTLAFQGIVAREPIVTITGPSLASVLLGLAAEVHK